MVTTQLERAFMRQGWLFTLLILLCTSADAKVPNWALSPPQTDDNWFYAAGSGATLAKAKQSALAQIADQLQLRVKSTSQQFVTREPGQEDEFYLELDLLQVSKSFDFNRVEVVKQAFDKSENTFYLITRVHKRSFFAMQEQRLMEQLSKLRVQSSDDKGRQLDRLMAFNLQKNSLYSQLYLLNAFGVDSQASQAQLDGLKHDFYQLANATTAQAYSPSEPVSQWLTSWLLAAGFNLVEQEQAPQFQLVASDLNTWQGRDDFHQAIAYRVDIVATYNDRVVQQHQLQAKAFASDLVEAEQQAWQSLTQQLASRK